MIKFLVFITFFCIAPLFAQDGNNQTLSTGKKHYSTNEFSIDFPGDWQLNNSGTMGTTIIALSPQQENDSFLENFNVIEIPIEKGTMLEGLTDSALKMIGNVMTDFELINRSIINIKGQECAKITYTFKQGKFKLKTNQYLILGKEKAFLITSTYLINTYQDYITTNEEVINTFRLK